MKEKPLLECRFAGTRLTKVGCGGAQYVAPGYYLGGGDLLVCENHAREAMAMNPFGTKYKPYTK